MEEITQTTLLKEAFRRGYRVNEKGEVLGLSNQVLSLSANKQGYYSFNIRIKTLVTRIFVHRLQAYQKYGDKIFEESIVVRHFNGNSRDNSEENILIGTQSDNMMDKPEKQRILDASSPKYDHQSIISDRKKGMTYTELMIKYDISSKGTIGFIINNSLESQDFSKKYKEIT